MTAKAALCMALLRGDVLNVSNCFKTIGLTNIGREIPRMVETPFGVEVSRVHMTGKNKFKQPIFWTNYKLNRTKYNLPGIRQMEEYVAKETNGMFIYSKHSSVKTPSILKQTALQL